MSSKTLKMLCYCNWTVHCTWTSGVSLWLYTSLVPHFKTAWCTENSSIKQVNASCYTEVFLTPYMDSVAHRSMMPYATIKLTVQLLITFPRCVGWSWAALFVYVQRVFFAQRVAYDLTGPTFFCDWVIFTFIAIYLYFIVCQILTTGGYFTHCLRLWIHYFCIACIIWKFTSVCYKYCYLACLV